MTVLGTIGPIGAAGSKVFTVGVSSNKILMTIGGKSGGDTYLHRCDGIWIAGGTQYFTECTSSSTSEPTSGKCIKLRDSAGTTIYEGNVTSTSATQITINFTVMPASTIPILLEID